MKKVNTKISANEINRFVYCPYQWYYGRSYGQKELKERYKALGTGKSSQDHHFKKGVKFHKRYYRLYRMKRIVALLALLGSIVGILGVIKWYL